MMSLASSLPRRVDEEDCNFVIEGSPATKKNSMRIMRGRAGRPFLMQSVAAKGWAASAFGQLMRQRRNDSGIESPVNMRALVYRDRAVGDIVNYLAAVCDALEEAGIVVNDKWILGLDGSRLLIDRVRPRVEITLTDL